MVTTHVFPRKFHCSLPSICIHVTPHHKVHSEFFFQAVALVIDFLFLALTGCVVEQFLVT